MPKAKKPKDLRKYVIRLLEMQTLRIGKAYDYEAGLLNKAKKEKQAIVLNPVLRPEFEVAVKLVECLFKVGGGTSEVSGLLEEVVEDDAPIELSPEEQAKVDKANDTIKKLAGK